MASVAALASLAPADGPTPETAARPEPPPQYPTGDEVKPALAFGAPRVHLAPIAPPSASQAPWRGIVVGLALWASTLVGAFLLGRGQLWAQVLDLRLQTDQMAQQCRVWEAR